MLCMFNVVNEKLLQLTAFSPTNTLTYVFAVPSLVQEQLSAETCVEGQ
jgi:hypothetical protein